MNIQMQIKVEEATTYPFYCSVSEIIIDFEFQFFLLTFDLRIYLIQFNYFVNLRP